MLPSLNKPIDFADDVAAIHGVQIVELLKHQRRGERWEIRNLTLPSKSVSHNRLGYRVDLDGTIFAVHWVRSLVRMERISR
jgi:hypothetical protein